MNTNIILCTAAQMPLHMTLATLGAVFLFFIFPLIVLKWEKIARFLGNLIALPSKAIQAFRKISFPKFYWIPAIGISAFILLFVILSSGCESKQDIKENIDSLRSQRTSLETEIQTLSSQESTKQTEIASLNEKLKDLHIYDSGKTPQYILKIHLKQTHVSLSIKKYINDQMNAIDFELPVDKDFYNSVSVGTNIVDNFRVGSFVLYGSMGSWDMTVSGKEIR